MSDGYDKTSDYLKLRDEFDEKVRLLQESCPHKKISDWMPKWWAPGHSTGFEVKICWNCDKELEKRGESITHIVPLDKDGFPIDEDEDEAK